MITIPPSALEKGARAAHDQWRHECAVSDNEPVENWREWADLELAEQLGWIEQARAAFLAIVEAWPGMNAKAATDHVMLLNSTPALILPLTENLDAEA